MTTIDQTSTASPHKRDSAPPSPEAADKLVAGGPMVQPKPTPLVRAPARPARIRARHVGIILSFLVFFCVPTTAAGWYLWVRAADQYASYLGFSVRSESEPNPMELLGALGSMGSNSGSDTEILYKFLSSHDIVQRIDKRLDLRRIWAGRANDPIFHYNGDTSAEKLLKHWERKVDVYLDKGMIDVRVLAFSAKDARAVGNAILEESQKMVNDINDVARSDTLRYAEADLQRALDRLKVARQAISRFRNKYKIIDPTADVAGLAGIETSLQQQLAEALIQQGILRANASEDDPRLDQAKLRVDVIRQQIAEERGKVGNNATDDALADVVGKFEVLQVDRQFAETAYTTALAAMETARAEAQRQSRYLAPYLRPTLAQSAEYPQRLKLLLTIASFALLIWLVGVMTWYSIRNRR